MAGPEGGGNWLISRVTGSKVQFLFYTTSLAINERVDPQRKNRLNNIIRTKTVFDVFATSKVIPHPNYLLDPFHLKKKGKAKYFVLQSFVSTTTPGYLVFCRYCYAKLLHFRYKKGL